MTRKRAALTYLILLVFLVPMAAAITFYRGDLRPFDPKLTIGLTALTLVNVMKTFGLVVGLNLIVGLILRHPANVLAWVVPGTGLILVAHLFLGDSFGLTSLAHIGWLDGFLLYLPSIALMSLLGGFLGQMIWPR